MHDNPIEPLADLPAKSASPLLTGRRKAFRALRHSNYQLFFVGQLISLIGTWMQQTAQPLLVVDLAKDNPGLWLGIIGFVPLIPLVPLALIAGSLADRYSKRTIIVLTQTVMMLQAFALAYLKLSGQIQMWHVFALTLVVGAANAIDVPARQSFVVEMVGHRDDLDSAIALNSAIFNLSRAIGPVLAALLIAPLGLGVAFLINGLSYLAVIASLLMMRLPAAPEVARPPRMGAHMKEGLRYVWRQESLRVLMSMVAVAAFLSMPFMTLMPVFVQSEVLPDGTLHPIGPLAASALPVNQWVCSRITCQDPNAVPFGLLMGAFGTGALAGALLVGLYGDRGRGRWMTIGNLGLPIGLMLFAISQSFWLTALLLLGIGVVFILQNVMTNTLVQLSAPDGFRGRIMSVYSMLFQGMMGAGRMQAGLTMSLTGAPFAVLVGAALSLVYSVFVFFRWPKVRRLK
jgi:MFS family permease